MKENGNSHTVVVLQNRRAQVREKFLELLMGHPDGRHWSELVKKQP